MGKAILENRGKTQYWRKRRDEKTQRWRKSPLSYRRCFTVSKKMPPKNRMRCRAYFLYAPIRTYTHLYALYAALHGRNPIGLLPKSRLGKKSEGCFEMECVKTIRAPVRWEVQRAPAPEKITPCPGKFGCARGGRAKFHGFGCWPVQFLI